MVIGEKPNPHRQKPTQSPQKETSDKAIISHGLGLDLFISKGEKFHVLVLCGYCTVMLSLKSVHLGILGLRPRPEITMRLSGQLGSTQAVCRDVE